jgi:NAD(P)-dependent dehydrogenase (short-subunit alcohol dehydrogenase family)
MSDLQRPLGSGFGAATTASEVLLNVNLSGLTAIVTGGYSGLGLVTTRALVDAGARVIVAAKSPQCAQASLGNLSGVEFGALDLTDPESIDGFAKSFLARGEPLGILINSAGIMATPLVRDARGNESQFSTNHLGHFALTLNLLPALRRAQGARVVSVSSRGHQISAIDFSDINFEHRIYDKWIAYGQSKTANALFAVGLDARVSGDGIRAFSVHPGSVLGPLARHLAPDEIRSFGVFDPSGNVIVDPERDLKSPEQGAATAVWCATTELLNGYGGLYCENCDIATIAAPNGKPPGGVAPWAMDPDAAECLWKASERLMSGSGIRISVCNDVLSTF